MSQPAKVLIIDDSAVARQTLKNIFRRPELEVVGTAPDALIALENFRIESGCPDPGCADAENGWTDLSGKADEIQADAGSDGQFLYQEGSETAMRSLELGAVDIIEKPKFEVREGLKKCDPDHG